MNRTPRPPKETDAVTHRPSRLTDDPTCAVHPFHERQTGGPLDAYGNDLDTPCGPGRFADPYEAASPAAWPTEDPDPEQTAYVARRGRFSIRSAADLTTGLSTFDALAELDAYAPDARWQQDSALYALTGLDVGQSITLDGTTVTRRA